MSSVARVFTTHGNRFAVPVAAVDEVTATAPAERLKRKHFVGGFNKQWRELDFR